MMAVDSIRNDLQHISGWPFNSGVIVRLVTVVILPLSLVLASTYLVRILNP